MAPRRKKSGNGSNKSESDSEVTLKNKIDNNGSERTDMNLKINTVRKTLNERRKMLEIQEEQTRHSLGLSAENDACARNLIKSFMKDVSKKVERKQEKRKAAVATEDFSRKAQQNSVTSTKSVRETFAVPRTRKDISQHNEGLIKLITEIVKQNPNLKESVIKCASEIPNLRGRQIFVYDLDGPTCSRYREMSKNDHFNDRSANSTKTNGLVEIKEPTKKKTAKYELEKYINSSVKDYVEKGTELAESLIFNYSMNLEEYANRLVENDLGRIVEAEIRINRKNNSQSFIPLSTERNSGIRDAAIYLPVARMYAFEGDTVRAFVFNPVSTTIVDLSGSGDDDDQIESDGLNNSIVMHCPKAFAIAIVKEGSQRQFIGAVCFRNFVKLHDGENYYKLRPNDIRTPMVFIPQSSCQEYLKEIEKLEMDMLFLAKFVKTDINGHCIGEIIQPIGKAGELETETKAILISNGLHEIKPYEERFNAIFDNKPLQIVPEDLVHREDLRKCCIFTIDPLTARDLDDAMSIEVISENEFEVGVHISDVSHYLLEDTELDDIVKNRATSIYLVNDVIHMLPKSLCFKCSLLPGEDKYAFSVFWRMNGNGEVLTQPRFTRSVLNSCTQFAYEHAQTIIDNPEKNFDIDDLPTILNGFTISDIVSKILLLHSIAVKLREKRYENGALSINNPKMRFSLDPLTAEPLSFQIEDRIEANFLIEEFMLLANQTVAKFIYEKYPNISILRYHEPPLTNGMKKVYEKLLTFGVTLKYETSKALQESMREICEHAENPDAMEAYINNLLTKPMARAKYFCSGIVTKPSDMQHYALSIPIYTHFTSPIRRYPDVMVHRLLAAALNYMEPPKRDVDELKELAKVCNDQKFNAKTAGDESILVYFKRLIKNQGSIEMRCVITEIFKNKMTVLSIENGIDIAVQYKNQEVVIDNKNAPSFILVKEKDPSVPELKLQILSLVTVKVISSYEKLQGLLVTSGKEPITKKRVRHRNRKKNFVQQQSRVNNQERKNSININENMGKELGLNIENLKIS
ncbi:DIS3-like exonuclease 2 [Teleopsis dalmanni]|uniref:DIS3-like exonuclease 2 n=1 Tax=Teleopsis dalmanni TaxID=139649 RepID=UPI0018CF4903|nr:DIS3-like exonuclease 2 [Teleopsis dalmanni]